MYLPGSQKHSMSNAAMNITWLSVFVQSSFKQLLLQGIHGRPSYPGCTGISVDGHPLTVSGYPGCGGIIRRWPHYMPPSLTEYPQKIKLPWVCGDHLQIPPPPRQGIRYPRMTKLPWVYGDHPRMATLHDSPH